MSRHYFLGIDIGTHGSKGVLVDKNGNILAEASREHELLIPLPGYAEHDPSQWWEDFIYLVKELIGKSGIAGKDIVSVACSAIAPTMLPLDAEGEPLRNAILYGIDNRASKEIVELTEKIGEEKLLEHTGTLLSSQSVGPKILWFIKNEPYLFARTKRIVTATTYLVYKLTGRFFVDYYTASAFNPMFDYKKMQWSNELWEDAPIDLLPELAWTTSIAGSVTKRAAIETGLEEGTSVIVGTADAAAEAVSSGVAEKGDLMIMYGTSAFFIEIVDRFVRSTSVWPAVYLQPGMYAVAAGMSTCGAVMTWFKEMLRECSYEELDNLAEKVYPGAEGLLALPYFSGERTPVNNPNARGAIIGLSLFHKKDHLFRALLEAIAYGIRDNVENITKAGLPPKRVIAIGGGAKSRVLLQIVSDVARIKQIVPKTRLGACYGDAFLAALGIGRYTRLTDVLDWIEWQIETCPIERNSLLYDKYFELYKSLYTSTLEIVDKLVCLSRDSVKSKVSR
ncbi:MAG: FGGY-family carbohydrate kinase [Actinobacteria bacterium]|nr:FGGY-family carbohydrate kinase [Actinomycetota bacterium]